MALRSLVIGVLLAGALGILRYFTYRMRRDRISLVGQAFNLTVEGLSSDAEAKRLAAARRNVPLMRFGLGVPRSRRTFMGNGSGVSRGDRNRNARLGAAADLSAGDQRDHRDRPGGR